MSRSGLSEPFSADTFVNSGCGNAMLTSMAIGLEDLPDAISKLPERLLIRFMEQALGQIESGVVRHGNNPLSGRFLRAVADVRESDPEAILAARGAQAPAVVLLNRLGELCSQLWEAREFLLQPRRKVLPEAAGIDEVRLYFPLLKQMSRP